MRPTPHTRLPRCLSLIALLYLAISMPTHAGILVSPMKIEFLPNKVNRHAIKVRNNGKKVAYISVAPYLMTYKVDGKPERVALKNAPKAGLLISPPRMILQPGQQSQILLSLTKPMGAQEKEFQLVVKPEKGKFIAKASGINVVVAYSVRVLAAPLKANPSLKVTRSGKKVLIENKGNTGVRVENVQQCDTQTAGSQATGQSPCIEYKQARRRLPIYGTYSFELDRALPVKLTQRYHNDTRVLESN